MDSNKNKSVRIWIDGCFDLVHYGHADAFRKAKDMGDYLIVGVISDSEIEKAKGYPPVFRTEERSTLIKAIPWVDEVLENVPYGTRLSDLEKYNCDFCVHGHDITFNAKGEDAYEKEGIRQAGKYREFDNIENVSTTDCIERVLGTAKQKTKGLVTDCVIQYASCDCNPTTYTSILLRKFAKENKRRLTDKVVYAPGVFDLFHVGHLEFLEKASKEGDYLIAGIYADEVASYFKGSSHPVMSLHERGLNVIRNMVVSEIVLEPPHVISEEFLRQHNIDVVICGSKSSTLHEQDRDPFQVPKEKGIFKTVQSSNPVTTSVIVKRITDRRTQYEERNRKKREKEVRDSVLREQYAESLKNKPYHL